MYPIHTAPIGRPILIAFPPIKSSTAECAAPYSFFTATIFPDGSKRISGFVDNKGLKQTNRQPTHWSELPDKSKSNNITSNQLKEVFLSVSGANKSFDPSHNLGVMKDAMEAHGFTESVYFEQLIMECRVVECIALIYELGGDPLKVVHAVAQRTIKTMKGQDV